MVPGQLLGKPNTVLQSQQGSDLLFGVEAEHVSVALTL